MMSRPKMKIVERLVICLCLTSLLFNSSLAQQSNASVSKEQGVTADTIVIGSSLPVSGPLSSLSSEVKSLLTVFFEEVNSKGGINGRRIVLKFVETQSTAAAELRPALARFIHDQNIFALTSSNIAAAESEISELIREVKVPLIGPFTLFPDTDPPLNRHIFYLLPGEDTQARVLVDFVASKEELRTKKTAIVYQLSKWHSKTAVVIQDQLKRDGLSEALLVSYQAGKFDASQLTRELSADKRELVFFYGASEDVLAFTQASESINWFPTIFQSSSSSRFDLPVTFSQKVFVSFPSAPGDQTNEGATEFRSFMEKYRLNTKSLAAKISGYVSAKLLVEGLKRAGKELTREKLIQSLEGLSNYQSGLTPPVTYGPNRRIGAHGAYVISLDLNQKKFIPVSGWLEVK